MDDYIERKKAYKALNTLLKRNNICKAWSDLLDLLRHLPLLKGILGTPNNYNKGLCDGLSLAINEIKNLPAADVCPEEHGKWLLEREPDGTPYCYHCSVCDDGFRHISITTAYAYCPFCGAKMDNERVYEMDGETQCQDSLNVKEVIK